MKLSRTFNKPNTPNRTPTNQRPCTSDRLPTNHRSSNETSHQQYFRNDDSEFPTLQVHQGRKFSDWFIPNQSVPSAVETNRNVNDELFTPHQLLELTTELITNLRTCRTKLDQFQVITKLAIKYVNFNYD